MFTTLLEKNICMGNWPSVRSRWLDIGQVLFFACLWTEKKSRSINSQKKEQERGQYQAILTEQALSIKDLLDGFRENLSCGTRRVIPSRQDSSILPARVANHGSANIQPSSPHSWSITHIYCLDVTLKSIYIYEKKQQNLTLRRRNQNRILNLVYTENWMVQPKCQKGIHEVWISKTDIWN